MVGTDPDRILRRLRRQRRHGVDLAAMADPSRHRRPRRGRQGQDPRRERRGSADGTDRHGVFRRRAGVLLSQRSRQDEARLQCEGLVDARRCRLSRRRGLSLPHRPQVLHDHFRRREHLSAGDRGRADHPSRRRRCRGVRRAERGDGRRGQGGGAAARHGARRQGAGSRTDGVLPQASVADQMPEEHRLRGRTAAHARPASW